ncbi:MAG TPA: hypothetical protein VGK19_17825 [Capsulimonadaceae bacterium]|jgi:hypothetical protein
MNAIIGRIERATLLAPVPESTLTSCVISLAPVAVLPDLRPLPDWLKDQKVTVTRTVADMREIGGAGDSIVLTVAESARYLTPLTAMPEIVSDPNTEIRLTLSWNSSEKPPEYTAKSSGREVTGQFEASGDILTAAFPARSLLRDAVTRDGAIVVNVDKIKLAIPVVLSADSGSTKLTIQGDERHRLWNGWYALDITSRLGGAAASLIEKGRGIDHLAFANDKIPANAYDGFHVDRLIGAWDPDDRLKGAEGKSAGSRRTSVGQRLVVESLVDEGTSLRSQVNYTLHDALPLVSYDREFHIGPAKPPDDKKPAKPKSPVEELIALGMGFRTATRRDGTSPDSRVFAIHKGVLRGIRPIGEIRGYASELFELEHGWILTEHRARREWMLHLCDPASPPRLGLNMSHYSLIVEPYWYSQPVKAGDSTGFSLAIAVGEAAGATAHGAWIAARRALPTGGVAVGIVARLRPDSDGRAAMVSLGGVDRECELSERVYNCGPVHGVVVEFPDASLDDELCINVDGIEERKVL